MLGVCGQYNRIFSRRIYMKIEFGSQRREMLLFLTTNMAAVTSRANQQYSSHLFIKKRLFEVHWVHICWLKLIKNDRRPEWRRWLKMGAVHKVKFLSQLAKRLKHNKSTSLKEFDRRVFVCAYCADWLDVTLFSRVKNIVHSSNWLKLVCVWNNIITTRLNILER